MGFLFQNIYLHLKLLFQWLFFEFKINKKNYLVYTLSHDEIIFEEDKNKVYIEEAKKIDGKNYLHQITDAREWNLLKEYFYKFTAKLI